MHPACHFLILRVLPVCIGVAAAYGAQRMILAAIDASVGG